MIERFERFSYAIFEINRCWHKLAAEEMERYGLRGPHAVYLLALDRSESGVTATQLCDLCGRDKADVSRALRILEEKALITRVGSSYRAKLTLTDTGRQAACQVAQRAAVAVEQAGRGFTEDQRKIFYQVLDTITANLRELSRDGLPQGEEYGC